jgi:hypothetical protein
MASSRGSWHHLKLSSNLPIASLMLIQNRQFGQLLFAKLKVKPRKQQWAFAGVDITNDTVNYFGNRRSETVLVHKYEKFDN